MPSRIILTGWLFGPLFGILSGYLRALLRPSVNLHNLAIMNEFDDIRPYNDNEVRPTLERLLADPELADAVSRLKIPGAGKTIRPLLRPLVRWAMRRQMRGVETVLGFQAVVERYMRQMIEDTTGGLTHSGLDKLDPNEAYLFVSNHRDIAMDPAFVNWTLYHAGFNTLRIAIGDNLLTKAYVSDLMRLNKSFIVNRSAKGPRGKLKAAKHLSAYIWHSITRDKANIWIAQREGRAKDGRDLTNSAVIGMFSLNRPKSEPFRDYIHKLNIVPVTISYEWDPCDQAKARELHQQLVTGHYEKAEHEDVLSIAQGIAGQKGHVHVAFGDVLRGDYADTGDVVAELDRQLRGQYVLHPSNCFAYQKQQRQVPEVGYSSQHKPFDPRALEAEGKAFDERLAAMPVEYQPLALAMYAHPVAAKLELSPD